MEEGVRSSLSDLENSLIPDTEIPNITEHSSKMLEADLQEMKELGSSENVATLEEILENLGTIDLSKIETPNDFVEAIRALYPNQSIPENIKKEVEDLALETVNDDSKSNYEFYLKIALAVAGSAALAYFGGPIASVAARAIYTQAYGMLFGIPAMYQPSYWLIFMPGREHFGALAYSWGPTILGTIAAPTFYFTVDAAKYIGNTAYNAADYLYSLTQANPPLVHAVPETTIEELEEDLSSFVTINLDVPDDLDIPDALVQSWVLVQEQEKPEENLLTKHDQRVEQEPEESLLTKREQRVEQEPEERLLTDRDQKAKQESTPGSSKERPKAAAYHFDKEKEKVKSVASGEKSEKKSLQTEEASPKSKKKHPKNN